jgi:hypothetical protein
MSQTSIPDSQEQALSAGDLAEMTPHTAESLAVATAAIPFGRMVEHSAEGACTVLTAAADVDMAGILIRSHAHPPGLELDDDGALKVGVIGSVLRRGVIAVYSEDAVTTSSAVRVRHTTNGAELAGNFCVTAVAGETFDISNFARWRSTTAAAGIAILEIDMTNAALANDDV